MVSFEHEVLVAILRDHPTLVLTLLRSSFAVGHHGELELVPSSENLTELRPTERRADAVLVLRDADGKGCVAWVVEVQLRPDERKRRSWPAYVSATRARLGCPVNLVVVTTDEDTARWCAAPIELDEQGSMLCPRVIGPALLAIAGPATAKRSPELAVVSLLAHRDGPAALDIGRALLAACDDLDRERAEMYADIVFSFLDEAARHALEDSMNLENYQPRSEFIRGLKARAEAEGRAEGLAAGLEEGRAEGREEGQLLGLAEAVLKVLDARTVPVDEHARARILACEDRAQLEAWLQAAITVAAADELF